MTERGRFIVFDGADGAGTTTQSKLLFDKLSRKFGEGKVIWTCEPSTGPIGTFIRSVLRSEVPPPCNEAMKLLFRADRKDHVISEIEWHLSTGKWVICDRYYASTLIYQGAKDFLNDPMKFGEKTLPDKMSYLRDMRVWMDRSEGLLFPDLTIILDVSVDEVESRRILKTDSPEIYENTLMQTEVCKLYKGWGSYNPWPENNVIVDGCMDINAVETRCYEIIEETFFDKIPAGSGSC
jgi:dTMP kinase